MLRGVKTILGYKVKANDGQCGLVHDFLFDDESWQITHLVVGIEVPQETLRLLLLSAITPVAFIPEDQMLVLRTSSAAVLSSPSIDAEPPVSRQRRRKLAALRIVVPFLPNEFAGIPVPAPFTPALSYRKASNLATQVSAEEEARSKWNPHLRSASEVIGYRIQALDGRAGALADLVFADHDFSVQHLVVLTSKLFLRKRVPLNPTEVMGIGWDLARVNVSIDKRTLRSRRSV
jgi:hypothetical protein